VTKRTETIRDLFESETLRKLRCGICSCLVTRMQDGITIQTFRINPTNMWQS